MTIKTETTKLYHELVRAQKDNAFSEWQASGYSNHEAFDRFMAAHRRLWTPEMIRYRLSTRFEGAPH